MKKTIQILTVLIGIAFFMISCVQIQENFGHKKTKLKTAQILNNIAIDEYGCLASSGYRWSVLLNDCISVSIRGIRLETKVINKNTDFNAFIVFGNKDKVQAELYMPNSLTSLLLNKTTVDTNTLTWEGGEWSLQQRRGMYFLERNDKIIYQGVAAR